MKEKIFDIIAAARTWEKTVNEATNEVLALYNVSGSVCEHDFKPCDHPAIYEFDKCTKCGKIR